MKLLFDENLSERLVTLLQDVFPNSDQIRRMGLETLDDAQVFRRAAEDGFVIATQDKDFQELCALHGAPPKVIWIRAGNAKTVEIAALLRRSQAVIHEFGREPSKSLLILSNVAPV